MRIDPNFWMSLSVNKIHLQNKKEIKRLQQTNSNEVSKYSNAIQIHYATTEPKYSCSDLQNILYGEDLPFNFKPVNTTEMKKITKSSEENEYFTDFKSSIFTCEYTVIPIYVATRIFQSNFDQNNELSKLIESYDPKKYCLQGKHLELGPTMSIFHMI